MPSVEFEPTIPASARPQTYALDRAATGIGLRPDLRTEMSERVLTWSRIDEFHHKSDVSVSHDSDYGD
jgi:hypothetical protein